MSLQHSPGAVNTMSPDTVSGLIKKYRDFFGGERACRAGRRRIVWEIDQGNGYKAAGYNSKDAFAKKELGINRQWLDAWINRTRFEQEMYSILYTLRLPGLSAEQLLHDNLSINQLEAISLVEASREDQVRVYIQARADAKNNDPKPTDIKKTARAMGFTSRVIHKGKPAPPDTETARLVHGFLNKENVVRIVGSRTDGSTICKGDLPVDALLDDIPLERLEAAVARKRAKIQPTPPKAVAEDTPSKSAIITSDMELTYGTMYIGRDGRRRRIIDPRYSKGIIQFQLQDGGHSTCVTERHKLNGCPLVPMGGAA